MKKWLSLLLAIVMVFSIGGAALAEAPGSGGCQNLTPEEQAERAAQEALFNSPLDFQLIEADETTGQVRLTYLENVTPILEKDGLKFKDMNKNGQLDVYEDWRADIEDRVNDLLAQLTPEEVTKFFPLYREMQQKQRAVWNQMKNLGRNKPADEAAIKQAVQKRDELELEQRRIIQTYHNKFFKVLPASKVYDVIIAETKFHRAAIRNWRGHQANKKHQPQK